MTQWIRGLLLCSAVGHSIGASLADDPVYARLRDEFLNVDPAYLSEVVWDDLLSGEDAPTLESLSLTAANALGSKVTDVGYMGWYTFGANFFCTNDLHGKQSACRLSTGGSWANRQPMCGEAVADYADAMANTTKHCQPSNETAPYADFSGTRTWFGVEKNNNFVSDLFPGMKDKPANRLCVEVELEAERFQLVDTGEPEKSQVANLDDVHDNLKGVTFELGTYTSVFHSAEGTNDKESGGTYQKGGSHFYHKPPVWDRFPLDRAFAVADNVFVVCFQEAPSGVRAGMRPPYMANPLLTTVRDNDEGLTDAFLYWNHVTRAYFDVNGGRVGVRGANYPVIQRTNRVWLMYEANDVFAMSGVGSVLGVDLVEANSSAVYPFTVWNAASETRSYRVFMTSAMANLAHDKAVEDWKIFNDTNNNGVVDEGEPEIYSEMMIELQADTDLHLVGVHTPDWQGYLMHQQVRWERQFDHAVFTIKEYGRVRGTSYVVRTHMAANSSEVANKETVLAGIVYAKPDTDYETYAEWNQDKPDNRRLVRNSPDFLMARARAAGTWTPSPTPSPTPAPSPGPGPGPGSGSTSGAGTRGMEMGGLALLLALVFLS
mmetsp:Transcript_2206/g.2559  ORF Transcript_2206/g.2559 Transcript_2206/m.2559 type:complete len:602 (+) Transcript_2206:42-1847(+)|eukprot:CAMPEP_0205820578 /NCGR_PEP_ID=MMETSP0206-20130828/3232_1 /ASSEMBLY_ACC=CAM_ASM_000279 /TAXON_ID=36767 /ORGANISM="Euplotes focardii, Strain TN1" /LENGTH=601 /DNA_ID=CAMNT_0053115423 /DNA_START=19 /DNA_END=1824 /DNA_ORIENTATION=+